jgi:pimeloyl-ACP methyl ester carboxylesterase
VAQEPPRTSFVVVHGAWGGGWDWWTVDSLLTSHGHRVERVTLTGLGERVHLASRNIGLETHVTDVINRIVWEQLDDVVLIGHSYGGVIATLAADRMPDRVRRVVYVDAILPDDGRSVADVVGPWIVEGAVDGMVVPSWSKPDRPLPRDVPHPLRTLTDTVRLEHATLPVPATYILTEEPDRLPDYFEPFADRARTLGWEVRRMQADHVPERSAPDELAELLLEAAAMD